MAGPTTYKMTVANFFGNVTAAATFANTVNVQGAMTANVLTATDNVSFNTAKYFTANNIVVKRSVTPANSTDGANSSLVGLMWSDASYIYIQANATHIKRAALSTW